jgi:tRNA U34 5-methylaminomethyl-2-thiouridine-forming methyltransferase MnmC
MKDNNAYKPLKIQEKVLNIVKECFNNENNGDMNARQIALNRMSEFLIETGDGSFTLESECLNNSAETMHTYHGGLDESLEKYVKPSHLIGKSNVHIMDICSGLGYTAAVCIEYLNGETNNVQNPDIAIEMVEISPLTLAAGLIIPSPIKSHEIVKKAIEDKLYSIGFLKHRIISHEIPENIKLNVNITDARAIVKNSPLKTRDNHSIDNKSEQSCDNFLDVVKQKYDAIFLAPFSPGVSPELYTFDFLTGLKALLEEDGMFLTYTSSSAVRYSLIELGLYVGEGPSFKRSGGTLASITKENIERPLSSVDERMIGLTDAGTPFRDYELDNTGLEIKEMRQNERMKARNGYKFASTVKSPVYLFNDLEEGRLKRRVLKDIKKFGIDDLNSEKSKFIVCPQYEECICGNVCKFIDNSSERVIEMEKRLNEIIENHLSNQ